MNKQELIKNIVEEVENYIEDNKINDFMNRIEKEKGTNDGDNFYNDFISMIMDFIESNKKGEENE